MDSGCRQPHSVQTSVLIAQAVFFLERGHRGTYTETPPTHMQTLGTLVVTLLPAALGQKHVVAGHLYIIS